MKSNQALPGLEGPAQVLGEQTVGPRFKGPSLPLAFLGQDPNSYHT